jgi:hypothetical protein
MGVCGRYKGRNRYSIEKMCIRYGAGCKGGDDLSP